jgi:hypothetical protein
VLNVQARYARSQNVVFRRIEDEFVLVPLRSPDLKGAALEGAIYYLPSEVAARVWELMDGARTIAQILDAITAEFEVERAHAERDLADFLRQLESIGGVELVK